MLAEHLSKAQKLYILLGITLPLAAATIMSYLAAGKQAAAITFVVVPVGWSTVALYVARKFSKPEQEVDLGAQNIPPGYRRYKRVLRISYFLLLLLNIVRLAWVMLHWGPLSSGLAAFYGIIIFGSEFVFVKLCTDESIYAACFPAKKSKSSLYSP